MSISTSTIAEIAELARLNLVAQDLPVLESKLARVLELVNKLNVADIQHVEPMAHPFDAQVSLREDLVTEHDQRDSFLALAPETQAGLYLVPKVLE